MAVTKDSRHIKATAAADVLYVGRIKVTSMRWRGTGLTVGQQLVVQNTNGDTLVDHLVAATTEDVEFITADPEVFNGIKLTTIPAAGGGELHVRFV